jgi:hypothetical protein
MDIEKELQRVNMALEKITERLGRPELPQVLTKQRAAAELSISVSLLKRMIRNGTLLTVKIGSRQLVPSSEVVRLAEPPRPVSQAEHSVAIGAKSKATVRSEAAKARASLKAARSKKP